MTIHLLIIAFFFFFQKKTKKKQQQKNNKKNNKNTKKQVSIIRKYNNYTLQTTHGTVRKSHITITITRHQEDKQSKTTSSIFFIKMIAKLERTQSIIQQNMEPTPSPQWKQQSTRNQQQIRCLRMDKSCS